MPRWHGASVLRTRVCPVDLLGPWQSGASWKKGQNGKGTLPRFWPTVSHQVCNVSVH